MPKLLTVAVPTFNRRVHLQRLLTALSETAAEFFDRVEILISDNASIDGSDEIIAAFKARHPDARTIRNDRNIGADANLAQCFTMATGDYIWILGDDDMPKSGALRGVLRLLGAEHPDLVFTPSEWFPDVVDPDQGRNFNPDRYARLDRLQFARYVNVWMTFISGIIVRRFFAVDTLDRDALDGSCLTPLGWVLPALRQGTKFFVFADQAVLATAGNTGGYAVLKVFGATLPALVAQELGRGSPEYRAIVGATAQSYLPQLIWNVRAGTGGRFDIEMPWALLRAEIGHFAAFWCLAMPVGRAPLPIAKAVLAISLLYARVRQTIDRKIRYRL